jgi:hypothetical protein
VIERLARLQIEFMDRDAKLAYTQAFEEFKANVPSVVKDSVILVNEQPRGKYAKLDKICNTLIPALLKVGITHRWKTRMTEDGKMVLVTCFLRHRLGHEEDGSTLGGPPDTSGSKNAIQACGMRELPGAQQGDAWLDHRRGSCDELRDAAAYGRICRQR